MQPHAHDVGSILSALIQEALDSLNAFLPRYLLRLLFFVLVRLLFAHVFFLKFLGEKV